MTAREQGMMLLTCPLGQNDLKPLTPAQYQSLSRRTLAYGPEDGVVNTDYLTRLGYSPEESQRIIALLNREVPLEQYLSKASQLGLQYFTRLNPEFPIKLRHSRGKDCPTASFFYGNLNILAMELVAVVGTRNPTPQQAVFASEMGKTLAELGIALISGGANGVDRFATEACLKAGGFVVTMVPDQLEKRLQQGNAHSLLWSDYGYDLPFSTKRAFDRNDNIHSLCQRAIVIGPKLGTGGSWQGAVNNLKHQWTTVVVFHDRSPGALALAEQGAILANDWSTALFAKQSQIGFF